MSSSRRDRFFVFFFPVKQRPAFGEDDSADRCFIDRGEPKAAPWTVLIQLVRAQGKLGVRQNVWGNV